MQRIGERATRPKRLRIGVLSPPMLPIPPARYAGTERIVAALVDGMHRRGHHVTLFAPGDSQVDCELVPTIPQSLWATGYEGDLGSYLNLTIAKAWSRAGEFDVIHSHVETMGLPFARWSPTPVVSTFHGRLDVAGHPALLDEFCDVPLVAISESQRRWSPRANWVATIPHGLDLARAPFGTTVGSYLAFVGRIAPEKGVADAVALARATGLSLRVAAKVYDRRERELFDEVVAPAIEEGVVEFLGEVGPGQRDELYAGALATVMLGAWPEPFGLVAIESMATGTPVIARRAGALPEIIEHGRSGFLVDDLQEAVLAVERATFLDRRQVRQRAVGRFSVERMLDDYECVYAAVVGVDVPRPDAAERIPVMADRRGSRNREAGERLETGSRLEAS
ncbi:MAG: glycosyltransferase family 4 protein [Chloroflexi bacterium]|nr:glycosyltransferase family 4 protein [Chloroflexota bacterium]